MNRRNNNNYNPYTFGYTAPLESASISYNPVYDPTETDRMVELLQQRQGRYDAGRQQISEFEGQAGGMQTYAPELLNKQLEGFNQKVTDMVKTQYGGDYGLAANDIVDMIAKERSNPFYKFNAEQVRQTQAMQEAKAKNPDQFYTYNNAPQISSQEYLQKALDSKDLSMFEPKYGYTPNRQELANKLVGQIDPDVWSNNFESLSPKDKAKIDALFGEGSSEMIFNDIKTSSTAGKLGKNGSDASKSLLFNNFAEAMVNSDNTLVNQFGSKEKALEEAKRILKDTIPMFRTTKQDSNVDYTLFKEAQDNARANAKNQEPYRLTLTLTPGGDLQQKPTTKNTEDFEDTYGKDGDINISKPYSNKKYDRNKKVYEDNLSIYNDLSKSDYVRGVAKRNMDDSQKTMKQIEESPNFKENKTKHETTVNRINQFEKEYHFPKSITDLPKEEQLYAKGKFLANLDDKYLNQEYTLISPYNANETTDFSGDMNKQLSDGNWVNVEENDGGEWVQSKLPEKQTDREKFKVNGVNVYDGKLIATNDESGENISGYPSVQARDFGKGIRATSDALKINGFFFDLGTFGVPTLSVKTYDSDYSKTNDNAGAFTEEIIPVPPQYYERAKSIQNQHEADLMIEDIEREFGKDGYIHDNRKNFLTDYVSKNMKSLGYLTKRKD